MPQIIFIWPLPTEYHEFFLKEKLHKFLCSYNGLGGGEVQKFRIKEPPVLGIGKHLKIKELPGPRFLLKTQIQRTVSSRYFKNFKEPPSFMTELAKTWLF
jgi:hypothetical protein